MKRLLASLLGAALLLGGAVPAPSVQAVALAAGAPAVTDLTAKDRIWPDERIYFVFIDRFNNGDKTNDGAANTSDPRAWHGGDLQGIIDKLDYIKDLGFTAIWITPHVKNTGRDYHGYGAVDFFDTDPHFGTVAKTKELVEKAHAKGIKVLFDIVVNHTGPQSPLVAQHPDWFHPKTDISNWNDPKQVQNGWIFALPDFDQSKPEVREYILSYSKFWIEQTGVDGFRLDTVRHVPQDFFTWYNAELQKIKPGFWLIGEVWEQAPYKLAIYQDAGVTAMLDFPDSETARGVFAKDSGMNNLATMASQVGKTMTDPAQMGAFLDNHDMTRFATEAKDDPVGRTKLGLTWLFTQRSIPIMYYGTEIAMKGGADPDNRHDFPWGEEQGNEVTALVKKLNQLRAENVALRRGTLENLASDKTSYAFARVAPDQTAVVVLNNDAASPFTAPVDVSSLNFKPGAQLKDLLTGKTVKVTDGKITPDVAARSGAIYVPATGAMSNTQLIGVLAVLAVVAGGLSWLRRHRKI